MERMWAYTLLVATHSFTYVLCMGQSEVLMLHPVAPLLSCATVPPPPPTPPQPEPAWTGAVSNVFRTPQGHILAPIVLMATNVSKVTLTFNVLLATQAQQSAGTGVVHVETMVPGTASGWVAHTDVTVEGKQIMVTDVPVARGAVMVRMSAPASP